MFIILVVVKGRSTSKSAKKRNLRLSFSYFLALYLKYLRTERTVAVKKDREGDVINVFVLDFYFLLEKLSQQQQCSTLQATRQV